MTNKKFYETARDYEFSPRMAEFLMKFVSRRPHTHTADQIKNLDKAVTDIVDELDEDLED